MANGKSKLSLLLAVLFVCGTLASCGNTAEVQSQTNDESTASADETITVEEETTVTDTVASKYGDHDYGGYGYRILAYSPGAFFYGKIGSEANEVYYESETGDSYSDAVYKRNLLTEDLLNVKISPVFDVGDISTAVTNAVMSGDDICDLVLYSLSYNIALGMANKVHNLKSLSGLDLTASWWDQNIISNFTYKNQILYTVAGHYNVYDDYAVPVIFCNMNVIEQNALDNPKTLVHEGKWTLDNMMKIADAVTKDLNGDGEMDKSDSWGFCDNGGALYHLMSGSGGLNTRMDENGVPTITCKDEAYLTAAEKIFNTVLQSSSIYQGDNGTCCTMMKEDRNVLYYELLGCINEFRDMESDFTLLPLPKGSEEQESYSSLVNPIWCTTMSIPTTVGDAERSAVVLDVMSGYSTDTVNTTLYELILGSKLIRDEETKEMLDYVLASKVYDWAEGFSWFSKLSGMFSYQSKKNEFLMVSQVEKYYESSQNSLNELLALMDEQIVQ
jgi:ABC-type glycerol-3-phosphate transport system substrate-binding protein